MDRYGNFSQAEINRYNEMVAVANMNVNYMKSIGFTDAEINCLKSVINIEKQLTPSYIVSLGYTYEQAQRIVYLYKICTGKVTIQNTDDLSKHLKKMFGQNYRINIGDLAISTVTQIPRVAVVAGLKQEPYSFYNSTNYKGIHMLYSVEKVSSKEITIVTKHKPQIKRGTPLKVPGMIDIKGVDKNGLVHIAFDKTYSRLCNRFIIVTSTRIPERHHGMREIICYEGTHIYVYAATMGVKEKVSYYNQKQRIYDFGFFDNQILPKLNMQTQILNVNLKGMATKEYPPTAQYRLVDPVRKDVDIDDSDIMM